MHVGRNTIQDSAAGALGIAGVRVGARETSRYQIWQVARDVCSNRDFVLVVVDASATAEDRFAIGCAGLPGKSKLWPKIRLLGCVETASFADMETGKCIAAGTELNYTEVVLFGVQAAKIRPSQAGIHGQVRANFVIVLHKEGQKVLP